MALEGASGSSGSDAQRAVAATRRPRIAPLLNQPTRGGHRQDRADRRAQQGDAELSVTQAQTV